MFNNTITALLILTILISCENPTRKIDSESNKGEVELTKVYTEIDTILEKNNPRNLALNKHQLFIDTTRNSSFFRKSLEWKVNDFSKNRVEDYLDDLVDMTATIKITDSFFPKKLMKIRKKEDGFLFYDRCDGVDPRYEIRDSALIYYGVHEPVVGLFSKQIEINKDKLEIELVFLFSKDKTILNKGIFRLEKTVENGIYKAIIENEKFNVNDYVVSNTVGNKYNVVVNNCPEVKAVEYIDFDEIYLQLSSSTIPESGRYKYEIAFSEWNGKSLGNKVEVIIKGENVKVVFVEGNIAGLTKGDVIDEGVLMKHKSGKWIISNDADAINADEIGGCTGGPAIIDFTNKKYIIC